MKVVEPGRPQKGWAKQFRCTGEGNGDGGCHALLLVEEDDLFITTSGCQGEVDSYTTFRCCQCGVLTDVKVPSNIAARLPSATEWARSHGVKLKL